MSETPPAVPLGKGKLSSVCFDLDGTLAEQTWPDPSIGRPIPAAIEWVKYYYDQGYEIVIHTARPSSHSSQIWNWLEENDLGSYVYDVVCEKPRCGLYVDDRAVRPPWV